MKDLMIDLETLGTDSECVVMSIGAVFFDRESLELGESFYSTLDIEDQVELGRTINPATIKWWMNQNDHARSVFLEKATPTDKALERFVTWIETQGGERVRPWGNGSNFDISIMESLIKNFGVTPPWRFSDIRDLRTFKDLYSKKTNVSMLGNSHNALEDAKNQAQYVIQVLGENK